MSLTVQGKRTQGRLPSQGTADYRTQNTGDIQRFLQHTADSREHERQRAKHETDNIQNSLTTQNRRLTTRTGRKTIRTKV